MDLWLWIVFFFFTQKTAYVMRISDWSSDVCSSDLSVGPFRAAKPVDRVDADDRARDIRSTLGGYVCLPAPCPDRLPLWLVDRRSRRVPYGLVQDRPRGDRSLDPVLSGHTAACNHSACHCHARDRKSTRLNSSH